MKYTQIPENTFQELQLNAGIFCAGFVPATGTVTGLIGATTGGGQFTATPTFEDYGEDIDNCPKNMMELKKLTEWEVTMASTLLTVNVNTAKMLVAAADIDSADPTKIVPRNDLSLDDFEDIWWIGDYSAVNNGADAGFIAIHLMNALNTGGFQIQSTDKGKGQFAFSFEGHYSMDAQDVVPFEVYVKAGEAESE